MTKEEALEKKAQNARELGLDYEPEPVAWEQFHEHMAGPNYVAPQRTWVGLTVDEIAELVCNLEDPENRIELGQKILDKLKERNT
jgi:hypothetical protein